MLALLAACGGGDGGSTGAGNGGGAADTVALSGAVVDGPVGGAQVCLYLEGANTNVCASTNTTDGSYTLQIPKNLAGFATLVAIKTGGIKLASTLGALNGVLAASGNVPAAQITHFTTAEFALADANRDGTVSASELAAYAPDFALVQNAATLIKAVIDGNQTDLVAGTTTDTLALASAATHGESFGRANTTVSQWFADIANAAIIAEVNADAAALANNADLKFAKYQITQTVTATNVGQTVVRNNGSATLFCTLGDANGTASTISADIGLDAARRIAIIKYVDENNQPASIVGGYNPQTGDFSLSELEPKHLGQDDGTVKFYSESLITHTGTIDSAGNVTGTFTDMTANYWSLDDSRVECKDSGSFTATKQ
jgi:hypothetical protein